MQEAVRIQTASQIDPCAAVRIGEPATGFVQEHDGRRVVPFESTFGEHDIDATFDQLDDRRIGMHPSRDLRDLGLPPRCGEGVTADPGAVERRPRRDVEAGAW